MAHAKPPSADPTSSAPNLSTSSSEFEAALHVLSGPSEEDKVAGLLLVGKLLNKLHPPPPTAAVPAASAQTKKPSTANEDSKDKKTSEAERGKVRTLLFRQVLIAKKKDKD